MIAQERLFLTSDRCRIVADGDPAAAFLLAPKGSEIPTQYLALMQPDKAAMGAEAPAGVPVAAESSPVKVQTKESALPKRRRR